MKERIRKNGNFVKVANHVLHRSEFSTDLPRTLEDCYKYVERLQDLNPDWISHYIRRYKL